MSNIENVIQYYLNQLQQDQNTYQNFMDSVNQFNHNLSKYVEDNLNKKRLASLQSQDYQYDPANNLVIFAPYQLSSYLQLQPVLHLESVNPNIVYNLNFIATLFINDEKIEYFFYLNPNNFDHTFNLFGYLMHISSYYMDNNILNNFYQIIHDIDSKIQHNVSNNPSTHQINQQNLNALAKNDIEEKPENEEDLITKFVNKYNNLIRENYPAEIIEEMEEEKEVLFKNLSDFLNHLVIGKNYRYDNYLDTLKNYTNMFDSVHLDKEIYLLSQYYPNLTIRPIIEFSFLKDELSIHKIITVEFLKFEISYFNKSLPNDKFEGTFTLIPYEKNKSFSNLLDLYIILQCEKLPLFDNIEEPSKPYPILKMLPFLNALCAEFIEADRIMKNPQMKKSIEAKFLKSNRTYNEEDLDQYIKN